MLYAEDQVCATFDNLVARQIIFHGPKTLVCVTDKSFRFEFHICPALAYKPSIFTSSTIAGFKHLPKFGPGSDVVKADPDLVVAKVGSTHLLVFNKFCVFRPQYLILTLNSFRRQTERLDRTDLSAAWSILQGLKSRHFVIFNCGHEAGCSRLHKHMQVIPYADTLSLFPDRQCLRPGDIPFKYYIERFDDRQDSSAADFSESLMEKYENLCETAHEAWQASTTDFLPYFPHNVVLTKRWTMVIPRRRAEMQGASANAAGMMGMVWVTTGHQLDCWKNQGPLNILANLGIAN